MDLDSAFGFRDRHQWEADWVEVGRQGESVAREIVPGQWGAPLQMGGAVRTSGFGGDVLVESWSSNCSSELVDPLSRQPWVWLQKHVGTVRESLHANTYCRTKSQCVPSTYGLVTKSDS